MSNLTQNIPVTHVSEQVSQLEYDVRRWKNIAAYLASCHAATLEGLPKSASKYARKRHVDICLAAVKYLRSLDNPRPIYSIGGEERIEADIKRCEEAAKNHAKAC